MTQTQLFSAPMGLWGFTETAISRSRRLIFSETGRIENKIAPSIPRIWVYNQTVKLLSLIIRVIKITSYTQFHGYIRWIIRQTKQP